MLSSDSRHTSGLPELMAALDGRKREADIIPLLKEYVARFSFDYFSYRIVLSKMKAVDYQEGIVANNFPSEWVQEYLDDRLLRIDPFLAFAAGRASPVIWSQIEPQLDLDQKQKKYIQRARESGLTDGVSVPVAQAFGTFAIFHFACRLGTVDMTFSEMAELNYVCASVHDRISELRNQGQQEFTRLSVRERIVMRHIADGMTNPEIARAMEISPNTVATMLKRIFVKLETETRSTALLKAVSTGQLFVSEKD